jgi:ketosteroid isomerase-like protein
MVWLLPTNSQRAVARVIGQGKKSGVEVARTWACGWTLREGKILRMVGYADRDQALEPVGLAG